MAGKCLVNMVRRAVLVRPEVAANWPQFPLSPDAPSCLHQSRGPARRWERWPEGGDAV